jgi:ankyrin repeat protein
MAPKKKATSKAAAGKQTSAGASAVVSAAADERGGADTSAALIARDEWFELLLKRPDLLDSYKGNIHARHASGENGLHYTAFHWKLSSLTWCIEHRVARGWIDSRTATASKLTALMAACQAGAGDDNPSHGVECVTALIRAGANPLAQCGIKGYTPLHYAVAANHVDIVRFFATRAWDWISLFDVKSKTIPAETPLQLAQRLELRDIVTMIEAAKVRV